MPAIIPHHCINEKDTKKYEKHGTTKKYYCNPVDNI